MRIFMPMIIGSLYQEGCVKRNWCNPKQYVVVDLGKYVDWFHRRVQNFPPPVFVGDTFEVAHDVAKELNVEIKTF